MGTINMTPTQTSNLAPSNHAQQTPYIVWTDLIIADAVTAKGTALADDDVIQVLDIPTHTLVLAAGLEVVAAMTGTSTDTALDLGITGVDADVFVDGFDYDGAAVGDRPAPPAAYFPLIVGGTADTLDILIEAMTGTMLTGTLRVWALLQDLNFYTFRPGIAVRAS